MKRWRPARRWLASGLLLFLGLQLVPAGYPPASPLADAALKAPPSVQAILARSCFDCHSEETAWPWYARVAPLSWWLAGEVRRGRAGLDFSHWQSYSPRQQGFLLRNSLSRTRAGMMPPVAYAWMHPQARVNDADLAILTRYAEAFQRLQEPVRGVTLAFCREDGQLGEMYERRLVVSWDGRSYHLWDPEGGRQASAGSLEEALDACAILLAADPAMRLTTWERRYRSQWAQELRRLSQ